MSRPPLEGLRLVGFENLSASVLRTRLLAARREFWSGSTAPDEEVRALHDPLFFHQLGGFGALALTPEETDAGYLLGVVSADRLAVVHALAVHPGHRRRGVGTALLERFGRLAASAGARVLQAVVAPDDEPAQALGARLGATAAPSPDHAGPGVDRLVLTRSLPLS
jgi:GNAT superfamily N-acetyltransferase